jgi:hypothetical protein
LNSASINSIQSTATRQPCVGQKPGTSSLELARRSSRWLLWFSCGGKVLIHKKNLCHISTKERVLSRGARADAPLAANLERTEVLDPGSFGRCRLRLPTDFELVQGLRR